MVFARQLGRRECAGLLFCFVFLPFFPIFSGGTTGEIPSLVPFLAHKRSSACHSFYNKNKPFPVSTASKTTLLAIPGCISVCTFFLVFNDIFRWEMVLPAVGFMVMGSAYVFMGQCCSWCCSLVGAA